MTGEALVSSRRPGRSGTRRGAEGGANFTGGARALPRRHRGQGTASGQGNARATAADAEAANVDDCEREGGPGGPGETARRAACGDDTATER